MLPASTDVLVAGTARRGAGLPALTVRSVMVEDDDHAEGPHQAWVLGDADACVVIDASSGPDAVLPVVGDRTVTAVVCTHGHRDHIRHARDLGRATGAPVLLHAADLPLWHETHAEAPDRLVGDLERIGVGSSSLVVLHTPGHTPGSISLYCRELASVFTGGTLLDGGPGPSRRPGSDAEAVVDSIASRLMGLPPDTAVHAGCGPDTSIGAERAVIDCRLYPHRD